MEWISKMLSGNDGAPSTTRVLMVYGAGVTSGILTAVAGVAVYKCSSEQIAAILPILFTAFLTATVLGYVGGKAADRGQT